MRELRQICSFTKKRVIEIKLRAKKSNQHVGKDASLFRIFYTYAAQKKILVEIDTQGEDVAVDKQERSSRITKPLKIVCYLKINISFSVVSLTFFSEKKLHFLPGPSSRKIPSGI